MFHINKLGFLLNVLTLIFYTSNWFTKISLNPIFFKKINKIHDMNVVIIIIISIT